MTRISLGFASRENFPSMSVTVPFVDPFTITLAPIKGSFIPPSKTTPLMDFFCCVMDTSSVFAHTEGVITETGKANAIKSKENRFCFKIDL